MRKIGVLIFEGFELLDVFGPMEMFGKLPEHFSLELVAETNGPVKSAQSLSAFAEQSLGHTDLYDILFVPGGMGTRREVDNETLLSWIAKTSAKAEFTLSVCTGSALLAKAGLLNGRRATSNKAAFSWVCAQGPNVQWVPKARWVEDGPFLTSSGVSAGMDMTLRAIEIMQGLEAAERVAAACEYDWHRDSRWDPFAALNGLA